MRYVMLGMLAAAMACAAGEETQRMEPVPVEMYSQTLTLTFATPVEAAAAQLAPLVDWADLDGALLIANDQFDGAALRDGCIVPTERPGLGVVRR